MMRVEKCRYALCQVTEDRPVSKSTSCEEEGLAGALAKALAARAGALKGSMYHYHHHNYQLHLANVST